MFMKKLSIFFFIIGSLTAIFSTAYNILPGMDYAVTLILIIFGILVGIVNISKKQETKFLLASIGFMVVLWFMKTEILPQYGLIYFGNAARNLMIFAGSALFSVAVRIFIRTASEGPYEENDKGELLKGKDLAFDIVWDNIVFVAIALVFILLILEQFYDVSHIYNIIITIDFFVWVIFVVDLIYLYINSRSFMQFVRSSWLDIIAVIPLSTSFYKVTKAARLVRSINAFSKASKAAKAQKATKLVRSHKILKYFSKESGFNKVMKKKKD